MATIKHYNVNTPPTAASPEGQYFVKRSDNPDRIDVYIVSNGTVKKQENNDENIAQLGRDMPVLNVSKTNNKYDYTTATARAAVPENERFLGKEIRYQTETGWVNEQYIGDNVSGWATDTNWKQVGSGSGGNLILEYTTDINTTRKLVKQSERKSGLEISYKHLEWGWVKERFVGTDFSDEGWANEAFWEDIVDTKEFVPSKNLIPTRFIHNAKTSAGDIWYNPGTPDSIVRPMKLEPGQTYTISRSQTTGNNSILFYLKDGTLSLVWTNDSTVVTFTVPENCCKVTFTVLSSDIGGNVLQLEQGNEATEFESPVYSIQEKIDTLPEYTFIENFAHSDNISNYSFNEGVLSNNRGYSFNPIPVGENTHISLYYTRTSHGVSGLAFYNYTGDITDIASFVANAALISGVYGEHVNGIHPVPAGATHAVYCFDFYHGWKPDDDELARWQILLGKHEYDPANNYKTIVDVVARADTKILKRQAQRKNLFDNFGIFSWNRKNDNSSELHSYNGHYLLSEIGRDGKTLDEIVNDPVKLAGLGLSQTIKFSPESAFNHSNEWERVLQIGGNIRGEFYRPVMLEGYHDIVVQCGMYVYTEDLTEEQVLQQFKIGAATGFDYNVGTEDLTGVKKIKENTYYVYRNQSIRIMDSDNWNTTDAGISVLIPDSISCEFGGFCWYEPLDEDMYNCYRGSFNTVLSGVDKFDEPIIYTALQFLRKKFDTLPFNEFKNRKVVVLGTSVPNEPPFGEAGTLQYPQFVGQILGFTPTVRSIGGTGVTYDPANNIYGLSMTNAEAEAGNPGIEKSYETQLDGCWDSELFFIDHMHNDAGRLHQFIDNPEYWDSAKQTFKITDTNAFDRAWPIGAMNYIIREIYKRNPRAVICLINDWRGTALNVTNYLANIVVGEYWSIPVCNLKMGNRDIDITIDVSTSIIGYDGRTIDIPAGSVVNPLKYQTKAAPEDDSPNDLIHPGRYGRILYAKYVAKWLMYNVSLQDTNGFY